MANEPEPGKNVTGGTGITAGGDVTLSNISGPVVVGENVTIIENTMQKPARDKNEAVTTTIILSICETEAAAQCIYTFNILLDS